MKTNELLANVRVASPCPARWGHMIGDNRARFCTQCQKHVYNLSNLSADEAAAIVRAKEGRLCARFYQRADGMVLTADCPVGAANVWTRVKRLLTAAATLMAISLAVPLVASDTAQLPQARARVYQAWDEALLTVKGWLGLQPPKMLMGKICVLPPPAQSAGPPPTPPVK